MRLMKTGVVIKMTDTGVSGWCRKMDEHIRRGDRMIAVDKNSEIEMGLFLKEQRVGFWERNHRIPINNDLDLYEVEA
jgi:hypothetical protein